MKRTIDVPVGFWCIAAFGLRQRELRDADWRHLVERDGQLWYSGGLGKNGQTICVPAQERAARVLREFRELAGRIVDSRAGRRLNFFLRARGLTETQKAAHELRAYVGARIFEKDTRAAQWWLRHSNLVATQAAYAGRYARPASIPNVL